MTCATEAPVKLSRKDFDTGIDVRWCPGCGDYSILANMQRLLPTLGVPPEKIAFISGIGCSSRFPYYMKTNGFHSIHGRAPAVASGLKSYRPDLNVWVVTGDGDALSIGGNHLIHVLRRNLDINILLFNNRIYGLTKGQYSPTSEEGKVTKSSPMGSIDHPFNPISVALGAEASFVARAVATDAKMMQGVLTAAQEHRGTSFIEIYQNCNIFNDNAFANFVDKKVKNDQQLFLQPGKPMLFAKGTKGIIIDAGKPKVVDVGEGGVPESEIHIHDPANPDPSIAFALSRFNPPELPMAVGVMRSVIRESYDEGMQAQIEAAKEKLGEGDLKELLYNSDTWTVQ